MADDRAAQIARIQQIERIHALEGDSAPPAEEGGGVIDTAVKGLDYQRGATGGPLLAKALGAMSGKQVYNPQEAADAKSFKAPFPGSGELLKRAGVLDGTRKPFTDQKVNSVYDTPSLFDMTKDASMDGVARNVVGAGLDIGTDPVTYESMGASALAKMKGPLQGLRTGINYAFNPLEEFMKGRATGAYKAAFGKLNEVGTDLKKPIPISQIMEDKGFVGNARSAAQEIKSTNRAASNTIGDTLESAAGQGAAVNPFDLFKEVHPKIEELRAMGIPEATKAADDLEGRVYTLLNAHKGEIPVDEANKLKSFMDQNIKTTGFLNPAAATSQKPLANALRGAIPDAVADAAPELSKPLSDASKMFASTDQSIYKKARQAAKTAAELRGWAPTGVDAMLAGGGATAAYANGGNPLEGALGALALKKLHGAATSTYGRTLLGRTAQQAAKISPSLSPMWRAPRSVWEDLAQPQGDE